jgi:O-antigen/teichoic acid export membrane protein
MNLKQQALRGISILLAGGLVQTLLRTAVISILARTLSATDFGVVAAALIVVSTLDLDGALGVAPAIIQRKTLERRHIVTGQLMSVIFGLCFSFVLFLVSPYIASLLSIGQAGGALRVLSWVFLLRGFSSVSEALLFRDLMVARLTVGRVLAYLAGYVAVGIPCAFLGMGYWALVAAELTQSFFLAAYFFVQKPLPLVPIWDTAAARELLSFGIILSLAKIARELVFNIDQMVIARVFGAASLGFYVRAMGTAFQPINYLGGALEAVLFPALSSIQEERIRLQIAFARGMSIYTAIIGPIIGFLAIFSHEVVRVLLGPRWGLSADLMQMLAAGLFFRTSNRLCATLLKARGRVSWLLLLQIEHAAVMIAAVLSGYPYGLLAVALAVSVGQFVHLVTAVVLVHIDLGGGWRRLASAVLRALPFAALPIGAAGVVAMAAHSMAWPVIPTLAVGGIVCGAVLAAVAFYYPVASLGEDGRWLLNVLAKSAPRRLPFSRAVQRRMLQRLEMPLKGTP